MKLLVIGAGGHAKVVIDAARHAGWDIAGVVDTNPERSEVLAYPVSRSSESIAADRFIVAIGDNRTRARSFEQMRSQGLVPATVIHPSAVIASSADIGAGTFVAAGVIINPEATIGDNAILNTGCIVEHDVVIGDHAHVGPNAALCGAAAAGEGALLGVGACVKPQTAVGAWCIVGAGSAVVSELPADTVCAGVPARVLRPAEDD